MERHYIVTGIGAYGFFDSEPPHMRTIKDDETFTDKMLSHVRHYGPIKIQPILIQDERRGKYEQRATPTVHSCGPKTKECYATCSGVFYQVSVDENITTPSNLFDAITATLAILEMGIDDMALFPIRSEEIPYNRRIKRPIATEIYENSQPDRWDRGYGDFIFNHTAWYGTEYDDYLWRIVAEILENEKLIYIAHFWKSSYEEFSIGDGDIRDVIIEHENAPLRMTDAVRVENALHNSYKVIEAICGGPLPKNVERIKRKLSNEGIDPHEYVGYEVFDMFDREQIITKVLKLRDTRNDRSAHGRIHANRKITFYELMDLQQMSKMVLIRNLVFQYPAIRPIFFSDYKEK